MLAVAKKDIGRCVDEMLMSKNRPDLVERICQLAENFPKSARSATDVVAALRLHPADISRTEVAAYLQQNPSLVESWLRWSVDQRTSSGWYFAPETNRYVVAFYPSGPRELFEDAVSACASYVMHVVTDLAACANQ